MEMLRNQFVPAACILSGALLLSAIVGSYTFYAVRSLDNTLSVTGSAKVAATADIAKWTVRVSRSTDEAGLASATTKIQADTRAIAAFMKKEGIPEESIDVGPITTSEDYSYNRDAYAPKRYLVNQQVRIESKDPQLVKEMSQRITTLTAQGIVLDVGYPEYYVSNLPELRVSLMGEAIKDAKERAEAIASASGQSVGRLKSASSGVVQVLAPNSIDVSDYGSYDLQTIDKEVMLTARAVFFVR